MRVVYGNTADRRWYTEAAAISWGFGVEVQHYGTPDDEADSIAPEGWSVDIMFGPWILSIFSEAGARAVFGDHLTYMGRYQPI